MAVAPGHVAIAVVTHNSADVLPGLLTSLPGGLGSVPWRLYVVDNASVDGSVEVARRLAPDAVVLPLPTNGGYASGINAAARAAGGFAALLVLNPDVRLTPGCVQTLLAALDRAGTGIAVPRLLDRHGGLIASMRREPSIGRTVADALLGAERAGRIGSIGEMVTDTARYETEQMVDWAEGSTQLISRRCWDACGPWDESYFLYSEETDFGLRARDLGLGTRYVPSAHAVHLEGDSASRPGLWRLVVLNRVRLYARRHGRTAAAAFWVATLAREASRAVLGKATSRAAVAALLSPRALRQPPGPDAIAWPPPRRRRTADANRLSAGA